MLPFQLNLFCIIRGERQSNKNDSSLSLFMFLPTECCVLIFSIQSWPVKWTFRLWAVKRCQWRQALPPLAHPPPQIPSSVPTLTCCFATHNQLVRKAYTHTVTQSQHILYTEPCITDKLVPHCYKAAIHLLSLIKIQHIFPPIKPQLLF